MSADCTCMAMGVIAPQCKRLCRESREHERREGAAADIAAIKRRWWRIDVAGYGDFGFFGTEEEAEEMRAHKAQWEGGVGRKEEIPDDHALAKDERKHQAWRRRNGYPMSEREFATLKGKS